MVTPTAPANVIWPAPDWMKSMCVPMSNATVALSGTVTVNGEALAQRMKARPSFRTLYEREGLTEWA